jgi:hypothetical protein
MQNLRNDFQPLLQALPNDLTDLATTWRRVKVFEQASHHFGLATGVIRVIAFKGHPVQLILQVQGVDNFRGTGQKRAYPHGSSPLRPRVRR